MKYIIGTFIAMMLLSRSKCSAQQKQRVIKGDTLTIIDSTYRPQFKMWYYRAVNAKRNNDTSVLISKPYKHKKP